MKDLIKGIEKYEAHICRNDAGEIIKRESLLAHTKLTVYYFKKLWEEKRVSDMLARFWVQAGYDISQEGSDLWNEMIWGLPVFHDIGKINPIFQRFTLGNTQVKDDRVFSCISGKHSILSSVLYLEYFLKQLKDRVKDKAEKRLLRRFALYHAYAIERHHSDLKDFHLFPESLTEGSGLDLIELFQEGKCSCWKKEFTLNTKKIQILNREYRQYSAGSSNRDSREDIEIYTYVKLMYSLLITSDYYATGEFMSRTKTEKFGNIEEICRWTEVYENTLRMKKVRIYQKEQYPSAENELELETDINRLRTEILCDAEELLKRYRKENLFYLEAPTGSGKSNTALDLSLKLLKMNRSLGKIYYIYPFNTLVEQNLNNLEKVFGNHPDVFGRIAVINSLVPIKMTQKVKKQESESESSTYYQRALLDRQFLNYSVILTTHVSLFDTMFGDTKESAFGFHQLMNSVIVLDEIQSYKNTLWGEIICFLKVFSELLNIKVIIMSATLPNLDLLSEKMFPAVTLLKDAKRYFSNPCFKERVRISYELLEKKIGMEALAEHVKASAAEGKKVLVEFIKKDTAYRFFQILSGDSRPDAAVEYMSGDDSIMERSRILHKIKESKNAVILVATQVIEAGVDLDMDVGYKDISKLDSEEQFLGRINRSCLGKGIVYFFDMDNARKIYREDVRVQKEFTLENVEMRKYLESKEFGYYYERILLAIRKNYNDQVGSIGLQDFFGLQVGKLRWNSVKERMRLIEDDKWSMSVYLARILEDETGEEINGVQLWNAYAKLLADSKMDYAEKQVRLSQITSKMNYFIYQIKRNTDLIYNDQIGDIFYIEDGEKYFNNGKLDRQKMQGEIGEFVDFI